MNKIPIEFKVLYMQADNNQYMQRSVELDPIGLFLVIELEPDKDYFYNPEIVKYWEEKKVAEVINSKLPKLEIPEQIKLTPKGVAKVRELINEAFEVKHPYAENNFEDEEEVEPEDW